MDEPESSLPLPTRLWFAWVCFFRVLFDSAFAERAWKARAELPPAPERPRELAPPAPAAQKPAPKPIEPPPAVPGEAALQLLALFQREGRLVDFLEQEIAGFSDAEIGSVARVVHDGCRKALLGHAKLAPVRSEEEGTAITLAEGYSPAEVKLSGNVQGSAPYKGVLRHRGWRASAITLPTPVKGHDPTVLAPAEVEL
jgi:Domain of unknown function (DUF2760)